MGIQRLQLLNQVIDLKHLIVDHLNVLCEVHDLVLRVLNNHRRIHDNQLSVGLRKQQAGANAYRSKAFHVRCHGYSPIRSTLVVGFRSTPSTFCSGNGIS